MISQSKVFRAVAGAVVPALEGADDADWQRVGSVVEHALALRPPVVRRQLALFMRVLNLAALTRTGRPLARLSVAERARFLESIEHSRVMLLRRGFWGLRTMILMGYYTQPAAKAAIGYSASAKGWQGRR